MQFNPSQSLCSAFPGPCPAVPVEPFQLCLLSWEELQQQWWLLSCPRVGLAGQKKGGFPSAELRRSREGAPLSGVVGGVTRQWNPGLWVPKTLPWLHGWCCRSSWGLCSDCAPGAGILQQPSTALCLSPDVMQTPQPWPTMSWRWSRKTSPRRSWKLSVLTSWMCSCRKVWCSPRPWLSGGFSSLWREEGRVVHHSCLQNVSW